VDAVVKEKALVCRRVDCEYLHPLFDRQCELRNMYYTWLDVLLEQNIQQVKGHPNVWLKASVPNLNRG